MVKVGENNRDVKYHHNSQETNYFIGIRLRI